VNPRLKKVLTKLLYPLVAVLLIIWVYHKVQPEEVLDDLKGANYFWVVLAAVAGLFSHFIRAVRWKLLIEPLGYKARVKTGFYSVMVGYTVNYATPRVGEVVRCALKSKTDDIPVDKLVGTVFTERVFDVLVTLLITVIAVFSQYNLIEDFVTKSLNSAGDNGSTKLLLLVGLVIVGLVGLIIYFWLKRRTNNPPIIQKVLGFIDGLFEGAKSIFKLKRPWLFLFYTGLIWLMYFLVSYLVFFALDGTSHLGLDAAVTTLIVATFAVIIPAPGGLGSFHYFVPQGLVLYGIDVSLGTSYAIISHGSQMLMIFVTGGISMLMIWLENRKSLE
jgi:glycosyltransferase 2 family protein